MPVELAKGVYWVGCVDWALRRFHGHELSTHRGSSYNAYLIVDEKVVLVDTVWGPFTDALIGNIREIVDPAKIDIVVANHAEPDHSGALPAIMEYVPNATLIVSKRGMETIPGHYHQPWNFRAVQTGERVSIGSRELVFIEAPMVHWPDSMFTYVTGDNILLSNDAFGQHYATEFRFNDEVDESELYTEALKYFANIITPFSAAASKKIEEVLGLKLPINMIAPSHGVIWRKEPIQIVDKYREWTAQKPAKSAIVIFSSMWGSTRAMSEAIGEGLLSEAVPHKIFPMPVSDVNDVVAEIFKARAVIVGSSTHNGGLLPSMAPVLEELRTLKFRNKIGAAFGSYGWSGESVKTIEEHLAESKVQKVAEGVLVKWRPRPEDLAKCRELGVQVAKAVKQG